MNIEIPDAAFEAAAEALAGRGFMDPDKPILCHAAARAAIEEAMPIIESDLRERIAADLENRASGGTAFMAAADIVLGGTQ